MQDVQHVGSLLCTCSPPTAEALGRRACARVIPAVAHTPRERDVHVDGEVRDRVTDVLRVYVQCHSRHSYTGIRVQ